MTKRDFATADLAPPAPYQLLTSTIVPRPIGWVSTRSAAGVDNLAPHSFFTVASVVPPIVSFTSVGAKDTLRNVRETGEFVVCLASEPLTEQVNETARPIPSDASEFDRAGLTREPSVHVAPPRVAESPVAIECRLHQIIEVGNCFMVLGEVVGFAVDEDVLAPGAPHAEYEALRPMAKLGRDEWSSPGLVSTHPRPMAL